MYKKIVYLCLLFVLSLNLTACEDIEKNNYITSDDMEELAKTFSEPNDGLTYQERYDKVINNMKELNSYYVVFNADGKGSYYTYKSSTEYIYDKENKIYEILNPLLNYPDYMDFKNNRHIFYDFVCYDAYIYQEIDDENIDNVNMFLIPFRTSSDDIISYENGTYIVKIPINRISDIKSDIITDLEIKVSINNDYYVKILEYNIEDEKMDMHYQYVYSKYNESSIRIDEEASNAIYYPKNTDCPINKE